MKELWKAAGAAAWGAAAYGGLLPILPPEIREQIEALCPNPGGVFVAAFPYYGGQAAGNLALYCRGRDYHLVLTERLAQVCAALKQRYPQHHFFPGADNSPIPEQQAAILAGLGHRGKHGLLIVPPYGSYLFLGTILTDLPLESTGPAIGHACTGCKRCQRACPTGALGERFCAQRCLSHITQKKGDLSPEETRFVENAPLIWGCDLCQNACPLNQDVPMTAIPEFREGLLCSLSAQDLEDLSNRQFRDVYGDRAFAWRGPGPLRRNVSLQRRHV